MIVLISLVFLYQFRNIVCDELPLTNLVEYSGRVYFSDSPDTDFYGYIFNLTVKKEASEINSAFPNTFKISNFYGSWTGDDLSSVAMIFPILFYFDNAENYVPCIPTMNDTSSCVAKFPNGKFQWRFNLTGVKNQTITEIKDYNHLFVYDGYLFNSKDGTLFPKKESCLDYIDDTFVQYVCRKNTDSIDLPVSSFHDQCNFFQSISTINDKSNNIKIAFTINYFLNDEDWNIDIKITEAPKMMKYKFYFGPNNERNFCTGNNTIANAFCVWNNISEYSNFEMTFTFIENDNAVVYEGIIVGEIIYAFGNYYRNLNISYSYAEPCWKKSKNPVPFSKATFDSAFCCKTFNDTQSSTTELLTSTMTMSTMPSNTAPTTFISMPPLSVSNVSPKITICIFRHFISIILHLIFVYCH